MPRHDMIDIMIYNLCEDACTIFLQKSDVHINIKVEFGESEDKVPLDEIVKRANYL